VKSVADSFAADLQKVDSELVRERLADIKDVLLRIAQAAERLTEHPQPAPTAAAPAPSPKGKVIVVARELLPSQLIRLPLKNLAGIISEEGGATTHLSILAKALNLPTLVGVPQATLTVRMDDQIILDTSTGSAYIRPSQDIVDKFAHILRHHATQGKHTPPCTPEPGLTPDGTAVRLGGNISLISELPLLQRYGAMGIGLYRTEFMFMVRAAYPSEDEQYQVFRRVAEAGGDFSATIRILDVGGDKPLPYVDFGQEPNPFLGWRGLRFLLANLHYLEPHLRAVLRATAHGRVNILLPMVADLEELREAKAVLASCRRALAKGGVALPGNCQLGIMLEVPSAIWQLPAMLPHLDFVSIGTNDLTQYTFAVDRGNAKVARWFRPLHPVILQMIRQTCEICDAHGKTVSLCGELGGTPAAVPLLVGAGVRFLSMNPWQMPEVRAVLARSSLSACRELLTTAAACTTAADVEKLAAEFANGGAKGSRK
jgi:phosphoenolpyruvate-protein phosphotransferase